LLRLLLPLLLLLLLLPAPPLLYHVFVSCAGVIRCGIGNGLMRSKIVMQSRFWIKFSSPAGYSLDNESP